MHVTLVADDHVSVGVCGGVLGEDNVFIGVCMYVFVLEGI